MEIRIFAEICSTERSLQSVAVCNAQLPPHHHSFGAFFRFLHMERAVLEGEDRKILFQQARENSLLQSVVVRLLTLFFLRGSA